MYAPNFIRQYCTVPPPGGTDRGTIEKYPQGIAKSLNFRGSPYGVSMPTKAKNFWEKSALF